MEQNSHHPKYREQIASAVSWELIYQLMRRYHAVYDLRVWETHPGGGLYDCLSLYTSSHIHYFDFNLQAQSLHIWNAKEYVDRLDVVDDYLRCENQKYLLDKISSLANLKKTDKLPPADGTTLACGFVATMFKRNIFALHKLKMYMGFHDTSDYGERARLKKFEQFPAFKTITDTAVSTKDFFSLYRYFFLENISAKRIVCLIDMAGSIFFPQGTGIHLKNIYAKSERNIDIMTNNIAEKFSRC